MRGVEKYFHLPYPPAVNNLFLNGTKGRYKSKRYSEWLTEAGLILNTQHVQHFKGAVWVDIQAHRPDKRRRDIDGILKAPFDLLVKHQIIEDDSHIVGLSIKWVGEGSVIWLRIRNATKRECLDAGLAGKEGK